MSHPQKKRMFLIDVDCGTDDAQALMMALAAPHVKVLAITCVAGNTLLENVCKNVLRVLKVCNRCDIPVYRGVDGPILGDRITASYFHGKDGLGDVPDPDAPGIENIQKEHAVDMMIKLATKHAGQLTLIATGPLTNLAMAVRMDPSFPSKLKDLYIMGGNMEYIESDIGDDVTLTQQEHGSPDTQEALDANISDTEPPVMSETTTPPMLAASPSPTHHSDAISDAASTSLAFSPGPSVPVSPHLTPVMSHTQYVSFQRNVYAGQVEIVNEVQSGFETVVRAIEAVVRALGHPPTNTVGGATASTSRHGHVQSLSEIASAACGQQTPSQLTDTLFAHIQAQGRLQDLLCRRLDAISENMMTIHRDISSVLRELANANAVILPIIISLLGRRPTGTTVPGPSGVAAATAPVVPTTEAPPRSGHQSEDEDNGHPGRSTGKIQKPRQ